MSSSKVRVSKLRPDNKLTSTDKCSGTISFAGKTVEVDGSCYIRKSEPTGDGINVGGRFTTTKGDLGIAGDADDQVVIEFWAPAR